VRKSPQADASLRKRLVELLRGGEAHVGISDALADFPAEKREAYANGLEHTAWQLLEHIRLAQWDILEFSRDPKHVSPDFPDGYWPKTPGPHDDAAWTKSVQSVASDLSAMISLVMNPRSDLHAAFPWGGGQTLLREALLLADHNAYHVGQIVDLRRALRIWKKS
jgi:DinB superfamily